MGKMSVAEDAAASDAATDANKVTQSISQKGENSYYFAHAGPKDDLSKAQIIEGDGSRMMANMGGMKKVETEEIRNDRKVSWREDYSWADEKEKVKLFVEFPEGKLSHPEMKVEANFEELNFE